MYAICYRKYGAMLVELTAAEFRDVDHALDAPADQYPYYARVSAEYARKWVMDGGHHGTPLYIDDGKVRYARDPDADNARRRRRR